MITKFKIYESYSSNKDEIREFIDELPNTLLLYRSIFLNGIEGDMPGVYIDWDDIGGSWTLDYNFADNIYEYQSFNPSNDDVMYILHIDAPKNMMDIEKTIEARLITDKYEYVVDDLTGEFIENLDLNIHMFEHENEIVMKSKSNGILLEQFITKIEVITWDDNHKKTKRDYDNGRIKKSNL